MNFRDFGLAEPIVRAISKEGYSVATPIQTQSIPVVLKGDDVIGIAQTGTGKTAAFALPILNKLSEARAGRDKSHRPVRARINPTLSNRQNQNRNPVSRNPMTLSRVTPIRTRSPQTAKIRRTSWTS